MLRRRTIDFRPYLDRWALQPDGDPIATLAANLIPVVHGESPAMLKVAHEADEIFGAAVMDWWEGDGAARVIAIDGTAMLMERAVGTRSLVQMVREGGDDAASKIICAAATHLHTPRPRPMPPLKPLDAWFEALEPGAGKYGGIVRTAHQAFETLVRDSREVAVLHGDLHHENVLDFGPDRGWLAIDPKGLLGDRGYDFANIVCNPERDFDLVTSHGRILRQVGVIAKEADYDRQRLMLWLLAYTGLSAAWILDDGDIPRLEFAVAETVIAELGLSSSPTSEIRPRT